MSRMRTALLILLAALTFSTPSTSQAAPLYTSIPCDEAALQAAITTAKTNNRPDVIDLAAECVYMLSAPIVIESDNGNSLTINGNKAVLNGETSGGQNVTVQAGADVVINQLMIESAYVTTNGGCIHNSGTLAIIQSVLYRCEAATSGGAIYSTGALTLDHVTINDTAAFSSGAGIHIAGGTTDVTNTSFFFIEGASHEDIYVEAGTVSVGNTIFDLGFTGTINSLDYNFIPDGSLIGTFTGTTTNHVTSPEPISPRMVLQHPVASQFDSYVAIPPGDSPTLDAGNCTGGTDIRGNPRVVDQPTIADGAAGSCDIGAYELPLLVAGCENGTPGVDILTCDTVLPTSDNSGFSIGLDADDDTMTVGENAIVSRIAGDGLANGWHNPINAGGNDSVTIHGLTNWVIGDWLEAPDDALGGDDTITVGPTGYVEYLEGDNIWSNEPSAVITGGNDTITIEGTVTTVIGDGLTTNNGVGGDDIIHVTSTGVLISDTTFYGDTLYGDAIRASADASTAVGGNDTITIDGTVYGSLYGDDLNAGDITGGDDTIVINGRVTPFNVPLAIVAGDALYSRGTGKTVIAGNDTIIINGIVEGSVAGDRITGGLNHTFGRDHIIINGEVTEFVSGNSIGTPHLDFPDADGNLIEIFGIVGGNVSGGGSKDTILIGDGAQIGGTIDGHVGDDTLIFQMTSLTQPEIDAINAADPASGTLNIQGETYTWVNFESIEIGSPLPNVVSVGCDETALQAAITTANTNNQPDVIDLAAECEYTLTSTLTIEDDGPGNSVTINGHKAVLSGYSFQYLNVQSGAEATVDQVLYNQGSATDGGCIANNGTLNLTRSILYGCNADNVGGGIYTTGTLNIDNTFFNQNYANVFPSGSGIHVDGGTVVITSSSFFNSGEDIHIVSGDVSMGSSLMTEDFTGTITSLDYNYDPSPGSGGTFIGETSNHVTQGPLLNIGLFMPTIQPTTSKFDRYIIIPPRDGNTLDAGNCSSATDGAGNPRVIDQPTIADGAAGSCDIGAYEMPVMGSGCELGTPGADTITCDAALPTTDNGGFSIGADAGDDTVTLGINGVVSGVNGDGLEWGVYSELYIGGDDVLTISGRTNSVSGDLIAADAFGGHDTITITSSGIVMNRGIRGDGMIGRGTEGSVGGSDIITVDGTVLSTIYGDHTSAETAAYAGNDAITINGTVAPNEQDNIVAIYGDYVQFQTYYGAGDFDIITVNGIVDGDIVGDGLFGDAEMWFIVDIIVVNGTVTGSIYGDQHADDPVTTVGDPYAGDRIDIRGIVNGDVNGQYDTDTVVLYNGAQVDGTISGGPDSDSLYFYFDTITPAEISAINAANPAGDTLSIQGENYTWIEFETVQYVDPSGNSCVDGTSTSDTITCAISPPHASNTNSSVSGDLGNDTLTVQSGIEVAGIYGDGDFLDDFDFVTTINTDGGNDTLINYGVAQEMYGDVVNGNGGDDVLHNYGYAGVIFGDAIRNGSGGDDTITNHASGRVAFINGDRVSGSLSTTDGNDTIYNYGEVSLDDPYEGGAIEGGGGDDTIINEGIIPLTSEVAGSAPWLRSSIAGDGENASNGGSDMIINRGAVTYVMGDGTRKAGGVDTITNESGGTIYGSIFGDYVSTGNGASDIITNEGLVGGDIHGDFVFSARPGFPDQYFYAYEPTFGGDDTIINTGIVNGDILGEGGNDTVFLGDGAQVGGTIDGGSETDTLIFYMATLTQAEIDAINAADESGDTLTIQGETYTWVDFETISIVDPAAGTCPDGTADADTLTCAVSLPHPSNNDRAVIGDFGDDNMTIEIGVTVNGFSGDGDVFEATELVTGNGGNDTLINYGNIERVDDYEYGMYGDVVKGNGGNDTLTNYGTMHEGIVGDFVVDGNGGTDTLTNEVGGIAWGIVGDLLISLSPGEYTGGDDIIYNYGELSHPSSDAGGSIQGDMGNVQSDGTRNIGGADTIINEGTILPPDTWDPFMWPGEGGHIYGDGDFIDGGPDTIINRGTVYQVHGDGGTGTAAPDVIMNEAGGVVTADINGDFVSDGDGAGDTITNAGTVGGNIRGDYVFSTTVDEFDNEEWFDVYRPDAGGDDTIINTGIVNGDILGEGGNDTVFLGDGAQVGGTIDGGSETDTLIFYMETLTQPEIDAINNAIPAGDTLTIQGETYTWVNFETIMIDDGTILCTASALEEAITTANSNDQDDTILLPESCTITLANPLTIQGDNGHTLTIEGDDAVLDASGLGGSSTALTVDLSATLVLNAVEINDAADAALRNNGTITMTDGAVRRADRALGAIVNTGDLTLDGVTLADNTGTALQNQPNADATVTNATVSGNGDITGATTNAGTLTVNGGTFSGNTAQNGGAIQNTGGTTTVTGATFSGNTAALDGGGALYVSNGVIAVFASTFDANTVDAGAQPNSPQGGAVYVAANGTFTATDSTFSNNQTTQNATNGGAIYTLGTVNLNRTTFNLNVAVDSGGAIHNAGSLTINQSTFTLNSADDAGAIQLAGGTTTITHSTLAGNVALATGGLNVEPAAALSIANTIIADNSGASPDVSGAVTSNGFNLIGDGSNSTFATSPAATDRVGVSAALTPLADNGGVTQTMLPQPFSPAIDAGNCSGALLDQRSTGYPRPVDDPNRPNAGDGCDIGAVERQTFPASCADGTALADTILCAVSLPDASNDDEVVSGYEGQDNITVASGVTVDFLLGDGGYGPKVNGEYEFVPDNAQPSNGYSDVLTNNGTIVVNLLGDNVRNADGGDDTIVNNGVINDGIGGDLIWYDGDGGNDHITNAVGAEASVIIGDYIFINADTGPHVAGNDTLINNGTLTGSDVDNGGALFGDGVDFNYDTVGDGSETPVFGGNDTIINTGTILDAPFGNDGMYNEGAIAGDHWRLAGGNDNITNSGTVPQIMGDFTTQGAGQDTIINEITGQVTRNIYGDFTIASSGASDIITNHGSVGGNIYGDYVFTTTDLGTLGAEPFIVNPDAGGNDTITNSGDVSGSILAEGGDDIVVIQEGASGGGDNALTIDGGEGTDTLRFDFDITDPVAFDTLKALIESQGESAGSITYNGQTFNWTNFEAIELLGKIDVTVTINEQDAYNALETAIANTPNSAINFALVDFSPAGAQITVRLDDGTVAVTDVTFQASEGLLVIQTPSVLVNGALASGDVTQTVQSNLTPLLIDMIDAMLSQDGALDAPRINGVTVTESGIILDTGA